MTDLADLRAENERLRAERDEAREKHLGAERVCDALDNKRYAAIARAEAAERDLKNLQADYAEQLGRNQTLECQLADYEWAISVLGYDNGLIEDILESKNENSVGLG